MNNVNFKHIARKIRWNVVNDNLKEINKLTIDFNIIKFKIYDKEMMLKLCDFLENYPEQVLIPHDICNFLLRNKVKYVIKYKFGLTKELKDLLQTNLTLFLYTLYLKKWQISFKFRKNKSRYGKYNQYAMEIVRRNLRKIYFIVVEKKILFRPRIIKENDAWSFKFLFLQFGIFEY